MKDETLTIRSSTIYGFKLADNLKIRDFLKFCPKKIYCELLSFINLKHVIRRLRCQVKTSAKLSYGTVVASRGAGGGGGGGEKKKKIK